MDYRICKKCQHLKLKILDDYESPQPLLCYQKPYNHNDEIRATIGLIDFSPEMKQGFALHLNRHFDLTKEIRESLTEDDFISKFKIPTGCPYILEHMVSKDNNNAHTFWSI